MVFYIPPQSCVQIFTYAEYCLLVGKQHAAKYSSREGIVPAFKVLITLMLTTTNIAIATITIY